MKTKISKVQAINLSRLLAVTIELEAARELYKEQERLMEDCLEAGLFPCTLTFEGKEWTLALHDNFQEKNVGWKSTSFKRFELVATPERTGLFLKKKRS